MRKPFTVVKKVMAGYLLIVLFSLIAITYALTSLHTQTSRSEQLVSIDFKALNLMRSLRQNILAQGSLEKQYLILKDQTFLDLLNRRRDDFAGIWEELSVLPLDFVGDRLQPLTIGYREGTTVCLRQMEERRWKEAEGCAEEVGQRQASLLEELSALAQDQQKRIDQGLLQLTAKSSQAYRITWILTLLGIALSAPAALTVILSIHRSVKALLLATREVAEGTFDSRVPVERKDEFGQLAREFALMGQKLRETEQLSLDANPLTRLPGNLALDRELEARITQGTPFSHIYIDLDHFKAYGDRYGYQAGSDVLSRLGDLIRQAVRAVGGGDDMVGHIGGDDYVVLTAPERAEPITQALVGEFDLMIPSFYSKKDVKAGHYVGKDRFGVERTFPLLTLSVAIINSEGLDLPTAAAISRECVRMKEHLKTLPGSNYLINRRHSL